MGSSRCCTLQQGLYTRTSSLWRNIGNSRSTMIYLLLVALLLQQTLAGCPIEKTVGDTCYTRVAVMDTSQYGCYEGCIYKKTNDVESDKHYCFKKGSLPVSMSKCSTDNGTFIGVESLEDSSGECFNHMVGFVRGYQFPNSPENKFQMAGMYCDNPNEKFLDGTYWLAPESFKGIGFTAVLNSTGPWKGIKLRNTHDGGDRDRATKQFSLYLGSSIQPNGTLKNEKLVLDQHGLEDRRQENPPLLEKIFFQNEKTGRYLRFEVEDYYGSGAGLQYLDMIPA